MIFMAPMTTKTIKPKPHTQVPHKERMADGRVRVEVYLPPSVAIVLDELAADTPGGTRKEAIVSAILLAGKRIRKK